jgi:hypothetical protein
LATSAWNRSNANRHVAGEDNKVQTAISKRDKLITLRTAKLGASIEDPEPDQGV